MQQSTQPSLFTSIPTIWSFDHGSDAQTQILAVVSFTLDKIPDETAIRQVVNRYRENRWQLVTRSDQNDFPNYDGFTVLTFDKTEICRLSSGGLNHLGTLFNRHPATELTTLEQ